MPRGFVLVPLLIAFVGCSSTESPELLDVGGTVTLDGKPVDGALVEFVPDFGRPSHGVTDASGDYALAYTQSKTGALVGRHTVKITTGRELITFEGKVAQAAVKEIIPKRYNVESELTAEVTRDNREIHFELQSR